MRKGQFLNQSGRMSRGNSGPKTGGRIRSAYEWAKQELGVIGSRGYIRTLVSIQQSVQTIKIPILVNEGTKVVSENRLGMSDGFIVTHLGIYIVKAGTSTTATDAQICQAVPHTFANGQIFTGSGEAAALRVMHAGYLSIKTDQITWFPAIPMRDFYRVAMAQSGVAVSSVASTGVLSASGWEGPDYGCLPLEPLALLSGQGNIEVNINLPVAGDMSGTSSQNFVLVEFKGLLLPNAARAITDDRVNAFRTNFS